MPVSSVDRLTPEQVAIVKILARNQLLAALLFMRAIVPDETSKILRARAPRDAQRWHRGRDR